ncbi:cell division protein ZipA [Pseudomonas gingeri NCPPB 3146 = LMG 5327]|uniref:ATP-binding protein n=2 Tax=Pseudomonas gingeri TaxID=117681 RepID=A0A7Y7Y6P9_9PSED|nr:MULTISPECIES: ATP-binding protein [Pseudomonas]NWC17707.1 ATP-binding protein [Pseudomonas gingeri]NWE48285.1 ATP-binding protein [Pseudomonas gingeri]NWE69042.1 ATP-binding protein [Pseudomonas gingeri]PNQ93668.1 cell division protein ZipA [Pseudomonas gingeri NCPPB 3146 = LMG 5327]BBP76319.1 cell division protein ZipA [Pseudomonas sp. Ost2]
MAQPRLHLMCGKIASGKSTLARTLAEAHDAILLGEDPWLATLYPGEIASVADYVRCARRIRGVLGPLVTGMLSKGLSVVLDFPANTAADRLWLRALADEAGAGHNLHFIDLDDATCRARLHERNARGDHDFAATDAEFDLISSYFSAPGETEGLEIVRY